MAEIKNDYSVAVLELAINLANLLDIKDMPLEKRIAVRANLISRFQAAIAKGDTLTSQQIKNIIESS